ncbi:serine/threonine-protein kinase [Thermococcus sp.]|uniref:serine/threonine-protein kinase n=1 Tax=Thermococcus sp. TaxID=35749 RepID=UPI0025E13D96|nr:serine/threonine-protein kinase [Thermococcus sp.]
MDRLVAKINWSFNRWKGFDWESFERRYDSGFEFVRRTGYAHEWWNFYEDFSPNKYYGFTIRTPQKFHRGIVLFISMNPLNRRWYFVGFYCDAVRPPTDASPGVPIRNLLPNEVIMELEELLRNPNWKDRHLAYVSRVLSGEEEYLGTLVAPKECSASFLPEAYLEVFPEDLGVSRIGGQWKITYRITPAQVKRLLEEVKRRHEVITSEEAQLIVERINRALERLREDSVTGGRERGTKWVLTFPGNARRTGRTGTRNAPGFPLELLQRYEPLEFLGEGGFARVYKVRRKKDGKVVALKIPRIDERTSKTFLREVSTWFQLNHPNIVKLYDADILPVPYLEMEFVEGANVGGKVVRTLEKLSKPVDEQTALRIVRGIAEGLKHAHSKGIYHLDLKPGNVLLKSDLTPKITDWGLAKIGTMSSGRSVMGYTPLYAAPEHLMPSKYGNTDAGTDVWQLGAIFYELLTGKVPFEGYTYEEVFGKITDENYRHKPPSEFNPALAKYDGIFEKLLAKRKEERYQSVEEFLKDLNELEESEKRRAELESRVEELKKTLAKSVEALKRSKTAEEVRENSRLVVQTLSKLALAYAELNKKAELLNTLNDLKFYTTQNREELGKAIETLELMIRENLPVGEDFVERLKVLLHKIERENGV